MASTRPSPVPSSSGPRLTNSRGCRRRPWKKRTGPVHSSQSPLVMVRSRYGWPGHAASTMPVASCSTTWNTRSPFRVGSTPAAMTRPRTVTSVPTATWLMGVTVEASS